MNRDTGGSARILVVDDSPDARDLTTIYLAGGGFDDVAVAESAEAAYDACATSDGRLSGEAARFDLIVLDIVMEGVDGIEACATIRLHPAYRHVPILMLSGVRDTGKLNEAFMAGADDFVSKPVGEIDLIARVRTLLRFKRERERRRAREADLERGHPAAVGERVVAEAMAEGGLFRQGFVDALIRRLADEGAAATLALVQIDELAAYERLHGADASSALVERIAHAIAAAPFPAATVASLHHADAFLLVLPRIAATEAMVAAGERLRAEVEALALSHGNSVRRATIGVSVSVETAAGAVLAQLPARMAAAIETGETPASADTPA